MVLGPFGIVSKPKQPHVTERMARTVDPRLLKWVVLRHTVLFITVSYRPFYNGVVLCWGPKRDPNLENYPCGHGALNWRFSAFQAALAGIFAADFLKLLGSRPGKSVAAECECEFRVTHRPRSSSFSWLILRIL